MFMILLIMYKSHFSVFFMNSRGNKSENVTKLHELIMTFLQDAEKTFLAEKFSNLQLHFGFDSSSKTITGGKIIDFVEMKMNANNDPFSPIQELIDLFKINEL